MVVETESGFVNLSGCYTVDAHRVEPGVGMGWRVTATWAGAAVTLLAGVSEAAARRAAKKLSDAAVNETGEQGQSVDLREFSDA